MGRDGAKATNEGFAELSIPVFLGLDPRKTALFEEAGEARHPK